MKLSKNSLKIWQVNKISNCQCHNYIEIVITNEDLKVDSESTEVKGSLDYFIAMRVFPEVQQIDCPFV